VFSLFASFIYNDFGVIFNSYWIILIELVRFSDVLFKEIIVLQNWMRAHRNYALDVMINE
jgi:hypothetical protein